MKGHWQKEVPAESGTYWTATRDGKLAGIQVVAYLKSKLVYAGGSNLRWAGWWWSEQNEEPPLPPKW
jgi:hypothetical protein